MMLEFGQISILEWCIFAWAMASAVLYILMLMMLYRKRSQEPFHNSFFKLFFSLGVADMGSLVTHYPFRVFRYWGWISFAYLFEHKTKTISTLFVMFAESISWFFGFSQYIGITLMALNRLRSVIDPLEIWSDKILKLCYLCQWGPAVLSVVPFAFMPLKAELMPNQSHKIYRIYNMNPELEALYFFGMLLLAWILIFVCCGFYIAVYVCIRKKSQESGIAGDQQARKSAIRLAFMSSMLFVVMLGINVYLVIMVFMIASGIDTSEMILIWCQWVVVFGMINPWLLLICSTPVRKKFTKFITPKKFQNKVGCQATTQHRYRQGLATGQHRPAAEVEMATRQPNRLEQTTHK